MNNWLQKFCFQILWLLLWAVLATSHQLYGNRYEILLSNLKFQQSHWYTLPDSGSHGVGLLPALYWNKNDGLAMGLVLHNINNVPRKFEFRLLPSYGFDSQKIIGAGTVSYCFTNEKKHQYDVRLAFTAQHYSIETVTNSIIYTPNYLNNRPDYYKAQPFLTITRHTATGGTQWLLKYDWLQVATLKVAEPTSVNRFSYGYEPYGIFTVGYQAYQLIRSNKRLVNINIEHHHSYTKARLSYESVIARRRNEEGIRIKFFAGNILRNQGSNLPGSELRSSGFRGVTDYLYSGNFLDRTASSGLLSQQMLAGEGGLKSPSPFSGSLLLSAAVSSNVYSRWPIALFGGICLVKDDSPNAVFKNMVEMGISIIPWRNVLAVHLPLVYSRLLKENFNLNNRKFADLIRFELNLNKINPLKNKKGEQYFDQ
ncbi:MAG: hypothetical protein RIQ89_2366 [Bacteroidota bacterium]|jgi:hypothetical protein